VLLDALAGALGDPVRAVSRAASDALVALAPSVEGAEAVVRRALRGDTPEQRWGAAFTHARLAPPAPVLLPPLVEALGAPDGHVRWAAARLLVDTGRVVGEVLPLLLGLARTDSRPAARRMAAHCLRQLAPDRPEAARVLLAATRDEDRRVRRASFAALTALLDPLPEVLERLVEALRGDADPASRRIAAVGLGVLGERDPAVLPGDAIPVLRDALDDGDDDLRRAALRALARVEPSPGGAPPR